MFPATQLFALVLLAPGVASRAPEARAELRAAYDASLESLRAGKIEPPAPIREDDRAALRAADARGAGLEEMRAGGAVEVLLILVLVAVLLVLL